MDDWKHRASCLACIKVQPLDPARNQTFPASTETTFASTGPSARGWCLGIGIQLEPTETSKKFALNAESAGWLLVGTGTFLEKQRDKIGPGRIKLIFPHWGLSFPLSWNSHLPNPKSCYHTRKSACCMQVLYSSQCKFLFPLFAPWLLRHEKQPLFTPFDCFMRLPPLSWDRTVIFFIIINIIIAEPLSNTKVTELSIEMCSNYLMPK